MAVLEAALSRPMVTHVGDRLADVSDAMSALETVSGTASGNTGSGKSAYSIILAFLVVGGPRLKFGVHARGTESIVADTGGPCQFSALLPCSHRRSSFVAQHTFCAFLMVTAQDCGHVAHPRRVVLQHGPRCKLSQEIQLGQYSGMMSTQQRLLAPEL